MSVSRAELETAVLLLPRSEQMQLVERVLQSAEGERLTATDEWWLNEAEQRLVAVRSGDMSVRPVDDVLDELERSLP